MSNTYNFRNLLASSANGLSQATTYTYTGTQKLSSITDPLNCKTVYGYDQEDNRTAVISPLGAAANPNYQTTTTWDGHYFKTGVEDALGQLVDYNYDEDGRLIELGNRLAHTFTWNYDDANRTVTMRTPRQQTGGPDATKSTVETRSTRGVLASVTKPSNQATTFTSYYAEGHLLTKTDGVGTTTFTYWPNGLLKTVTENSKTTTRNYDYANRLSSYSDGEGNTISYTYTAAGDLQTITYPGSKVVTYAYDDYGRLHTVTDWSSRVTTYTYDNASRVTRIDRPDGTYRTNEYDAAGQLRFIKDYQSNGSILMFEEARYDADGRITYAFLYPKPATVTLPNDSLAYDADNQLSTWNSHSVTFDADGNMTTGPLPSGTMNTYGYDSRNRLTSASGSTYAYNPDGLRLKITGTGAATFVVDPNAALTRTLMRTQGGTTTYYVYGLGLLYEETSGAIKTYHYDHLGNTVALASSGTTVSDRWSYTPFGTVTSHTGSSTTPFQFNGAMGVMTEVNGLNYMRARYYNPRIMRFLNADPIGFGGGLNWYAFAGNNPISRSDPFGLKDAPNSDVTYGGPGMTEGGVTVLAPFVVNGNGPNNAVPANVSANGYTVLLVSEAAQLPGGQIASQLGANHQWLAVYNNGKLAGAAGLGNFQGVPGANGQSSPDSPLVTMSYVVDHSGRMNSPSITTQPVYFVDPTAVLSYINLANVNRNQGPWILGTNDCNTWCRDVIINSTPQWQQMPQISAPGSNPVPIFQQFVYPADGTARPPTTITSPGRGG